MSIENHLVLYQAGHSGTYLVWLINQHKNFSQYDYQWKYTEQGHRLDLGCYGADWDYGYLVDFKSKNETFSESRTSWQGEDGAILNPDREPRNKNRTKDAIKLIPNHCCQLDSGQTGTIDIRLLKTVTEQVQPKSIILPVITDNSLYLRDELLNRWVVYCENHNKRDSQGEKIDRDVWKHMWFKKQFPWLKENVQRYGDNSHTIDIGKIIMDVKSEYLKLCEIIDEEPLKNIKELTEPVRRMLKNYK
ncbi:MAG: hypothetical protein H8D95_00940 [Candidatus Endolissoclinum sp.]|nr:hypothetical protein [Candidatus Endolissoclinum sp.]